MDNAIKTLAKSVTTLGESAQSVEGQLPVLVCTLAALVRTHPEPAAFAAAFRRAWLQIGAPNQALEDDDDAGKSMRSVLEVFEGACRVPLGLRPPGVAADPED